MQKGVEQVNFLLHKWRLCKCIPGTSALISFFSKSLLAVCIIAKPYFYDRFPSDLRQNLQIIEVLQTHKCQRIRIIYGLTLSGKNGLNHAFWNLEDSFCIRLFIWFGVIYTLEQLIDQTATGRKSLVNC